MPGPRLIDYGNPFNGEHPLNRGLTAWWLPLPNSAYGPALFDVVPPFGYRAGTLTNGPTWTTGPTEFPAVLFDGSNDYVDCGTPAGLNSASAASYSGWLYRSSTGTTAGFGGGAGPSTGGNRFSCIWFTDGNIYFQTEDGSARNGYVALSGTGWHHVTLAYDGSQSTDATRVVAYVDGVAQTLNFHGSGTPTALGTVAPWLIGKDSNNRFCGGAVTDVRLYVGRALSAAEAWGVYDQSLRGHPDTLRRYTPRAWVFGGTAPAGGGNRRRRVLLCGGG